MRVVVVALFCFFVCLFKRSRVNAPYCFPSGSNICLAQKKKKSVEALMNARLDTELINIAHVFLEEQNKIKDSRTKRTKDINNKRTKNLSYISSSCLNCIFGLETREV